MSVPRHVFFLAAILLLYQGDGHAQEVKSLTLGELRADAVVQLDALLDVLAEVPAELPIKQQDAKQAIKVASDQAAVLQGLIDQLEKPSIETIRALARIRSYLESEAQLLDGFADEAKTLSLANTYVAMAATHRSIGEQYLACSRAISNGRQSVERLASTHSRLLERITSVIILSAGSGVSDAGWKRATLPLADVSAITSNELRQQLLALKGEIEITRKLMGDPEKK